MIVAISGILLLSCFAEAASLDEGQPTVFSTQPKGSASVIAELQKSIETHDDWESSLQTIYDGIALSKTTVADLQNAVDSMNITSTASAEEVFYWYYQLSKFGVALNETTIKTALDTVIMLPDIGGLPYDYTREGIASFLFYNRYVLYAYQWAAQLDYSTSKWNLTEAYNVFNNSITAYGKPALCVGSDRQGWGISYGPRYYDECAETIDMYLTFWQLGIEDGLAQAKYWWNWTNDYIWVADPGYYKYAVKDNVFECEVGGFNHIVWKLYQADPSIPHVANLFIDLKNRALSAYWDSPQWDDYVVKHASANLQQRLANTISSWASLLGFYANMTAEMQNQMRSLLDGSTGPAPAWSLILHSQLYNNATNMFKPVSNAIDNTEATANGAILLMMLSTVPLTGSLAVPLQDCRYQDINNIINGDISSINLATHTVTISVSLPGTFLSMFGTDIFEYTIDHMGIWQLTFTDDWNSLTDKTLLSNLPSTQRYLGLTPTTAPTLSTQTSTPQPTQTPTPSPTTPTPTPSPTTIITPTPINSSTQRPTPSPSPFPTALTSNAPEIETPPTPIIWAVFLALTATAVIVVCVYAWKHKAVSDHKPAAKHKSHASHRSPRRSRS